MPTLQEVLASSSHNKAASLDNGAQAETADGSLYYLQGIHRRDILRSWLLIAEEHGYDLASKIVGKITLDIGCGQGDMTDFLASTFKAQGNKNSRVVGVDPADLDYGTPYTIGEAQAGLLAGELKDYLSFKQATAPELVSSQPKGTYSVAVFAHSLYYFPSYSHIVENFKALLDAGVSTLVLAEWSLSISRPTALPHLLAVLLQSMNPISDGNVRTVLSPSGYVDAAIGAGWKIVGTRTFAPTTGLEDGKWETGFARTVANSISNGAQATRKDSRSLETVRQESLKAHADALESSIDPEKGLDGVDAMDVWTAVLRPAVPESV